MASSGSKISSRPRRGTEGTSPNSLHYNGKDSTAHTLADCQFAMSTDSNSSMRRIINHKLESRTTFLVLEDVPNQRSHCRATYYLPWQLTGRPHILSLMRFNLKDFLGRHYSKAIMLPT